jgi:thioredoxin reductase (NADPH)
MIPDKDVIIIGAGGAGLSAAQYSARANLRTMLVEEMAVGGQAIIIDSLENYPALSQPVSGYLFSQAMEEQAIRFGAELVSDTVKSVTKDGDVFKVVTFSGTYTSYAVIIATGAKHKKLEIPGEAELSGRGVSYCATCDGPFFKGKKMIVVGGGDAACDESMFLSKLSEKILLVHRKDKLRAQKALASRVLKNPWIEVRFNTEMKEIIGDKSIGSVRLFNNKENKEYTEDAAAVFVFIGSIPQVDLVKNFGLEISEAGYIVTNQKMETKVSGLYAVGDVRETPFRQLVVAASDGAIAAHSASQHIDEIKGEKYI